MSSASAAEVTPDVGHYMPYPRPRSVTEAQFSMPFCLACALIYGDVAVTHLEESCLRDPLIRDRMEMVEVLFSEELARHEAEHGDVHQPARIVLQTVEGRECTRLNLAPTGMPIKPMSDAPLDAKFWDCAESVLSRSEAQELGERLRAIDILTSATDLLRDL